MLNYFLLCSCIVPALLGAPIPVPQNDVASHIVIVTPQAQVHLEPAIKYDTATFIHHLAPSARISSPHDDTIFYVPANPVAPIIPVENISVGRANNREQPQKSETKQWEQISQQIQQAVQTGSSQLGPQLSEAATAASSAAAAAGQGLFPALFPPGGSSPANTPTIRTRSVQESESQTQSPTVSVLEAKNINEMPFNANIKAFDNVIKTQPQQELKGNLEVDTLGNEGKKNEFDENDNNGQKEQRNGNILQHPLKEEINQQVILHQSTQFKNSAVVGGNEGIREEIFKTIKSKAA